MLKLFIYVIKLISVKTSLTLLDKKNKNQVYFVIERFHFVHENQIFEYPDLGSNHFKSACRLHKGPDPQLGQNLQ